MAVFKFFAVFVKCIYIVLLAIPIVSKQPNASKYIECMWIKLNIFI